jgi:hypothetical protein
VLLALVVLCVAVVAGLPVQPKQRSPSTEEGILSPLESRVERLAEGALSRIAHAVDMDIEKPEPSAPADNVELKISVPTRQTDAVLTKLGLKVDSAERRDVYFYDTSKLDLFNKGVVLRARKVYDGEDDTTAKLRPWQRSKVPSKLFDFTDFKCETDAVGDRAVESCSFTANAAKKGEIDEVAKGKRPVQKLFNKDQEEYVTKTGKFPVPWQSLLPLGPIDARVWKVPGKGDVSGLTVTAELWKFKGKKTPAQRMLEVSVKVPRAAWQDTRKKFDAWLKSISVDTTTKQETKTKLALQALAGLV